MKFLESIAIHSQDNSTMIVGSDKNFLIAAILKDRLNPLKVDNQVFAVGKTIDEVM